MTRSAMRLTLHLCTLLGLAASAHGQVARPEVPDAIRAPAGEQVILLAHASGSQIYVCSAGADGKSQWTLKAPQAELRDAHGAVIGRHSAGPSWRHNDGSTVTGKAVASVAAPDPDSVPWLLVTVVSHEGNGLLARATSIQRIHTKGGQPPAAEKCDPAKQSVESWIPYTADYYFFAPSGAH
jgi:Protein of unknown function (DUF3455)